MIKHVTNSVDLITVNLTKKGVNCHNINVNFDCMVDPPAIWLQKISTHYPARSVLGRLLHAVTITQPSLRWRTNLAGYRIQWAARQTS